MQPPRILTASEQLAEYLREELFRGRWTGEMPGEDTLAERLGVGRDTVKAAVKHLEVARLLIPQGRGRKRRIELPPDLEVPRLRIKLLLYDKSERQEHKFLLLRHRLHDLGHGVGFAEKDLHDLKMDPGRVESFVHGNPADAWIVDAAPRGVLEWFADQSLPAFALFGQMSGVRIAGSSPRKIPALVEAVRHLVDLGHQRIVMLVREERRKPRLAHFEQAFLDELRALGVPSGPYNLPDWGDSPEEFHRGLETLFRHAPPTALIISETKLFAAARDHLAQRGVIAPRDVSLICTDPDPNSSWNEAAISHIAWEMMAVLRHVERWVSHVERGGKERRQNFVRAKFVEGGMTGPVAAVRR